MYFFIFASCDPILRKIKYLCLVNWALLGSYFFLLMETKKKKKKKVYAQLKKVKASKASGPDGISPKIIKEFAYEFSTPICDILNSSYAEGVVPTQWKKSHCCAHSKNQPAKM